MSHYDDYYEDRAIKARKEVEDREVKEILYLKSEGFTDQEIKVILKAKELRN